jgi:hypothetical protein
MNLKQLVASFTAVIIVVGLAAGVISCSGGIKNPSNMDFTIRISGQPGAEFTGFCTHEVKYLTNSRTEETKISGKITPDKPELEFSVRGIEISCKIEPQTPDLPITITALKDNTEFYHVENTALDTYFAWYPPMETGNTTPTTTVKD